MNLEQQLKSFSKKQSQQFHQEKKFLQSILNGKVSCCRDCKNPLVITNESNNQVSIRCVNKCTDILLDAGEGN